MLHLQWLLHELSKLNIKAAKLLCISIFASEFEFVEALYGIVTPAKLKFGHDIKKHPENIVANIQHIMQNCMVLLNLSLFVKYPPKYVPNPPALTQTIPVSR